jgi:hypothetical protein
MRTQNEPQQRNVTLEENESPVEDLRGKPLLCPLCRNVLPVGISRRDKPYCVCNLCGIQIFFRGKAAIRRLTELLRTESAVKEEISSAGVAISLYNRLETLRLQKKGWEEKQGIIFRDKGLDNAIAAIGGEIKKIESELEKIGKRAEKTK